MEPSYAAPPPDRRRAAARWVPPLIVLVFAGGYACQAAGLGEPYPALLLPGFRGTGASGGSVRTTEVAVTFRFTDGTRKTVRQRDLLRDAHVSHRGAIARDCLVWCVKYDRRLTKEGGGKSWPADPEPPGALASILPGYQLAMRRRGTRAFRDELAAWLDGRARAWFPDRTPREASLKIRRWTLSGRGAEKEVVRDMILPLSGADDR